MSHCCMEMSDGLVIIPSEGRIDKEGIFVPRSLWCLNGGWVYQ